MAVSWALLISRITPRAVAAFRSGPVPRYGFPAVGVLRPALIAGLRVVALTRPRPVGRVGAPLVGVYGPAPVSWSRFMTVAVFPPVLVGLPGIVTVAVLATGAVVLVGRAVRVAGVTGVTGFWPRPVARFRHPVVAVRSGPVRPVCLRPVPFVPPVPRARPAPVVLSQPRPVVFSRPRPVVLAWPAPVVAYRPVPILRIGATWMRRLRIRGAGIWGRPWPGTCPAARLCRPGPGRSRPNSGGPWPGPGRPRPNSRRPWAGPRHPGPAPRHSRRNSPASRVVGPVRVRRLPRAVGIALVSRYAARISGRTRGAPRPGRRAGTRVAQVVARTRCPLGAGGPGRDSRRRSRPRFRPFGVRPVRIRPYLPQRDPVAGGVPVAPGGAVAQRGAVPLRGASAFPPPLVVLIRPGTAPPFVAFTARAANRGLVVFVCVLGLVARMFVCVLGLVARMPVPVVRGTAIYPVPITVGCGVTTFHRAPPGHFDSDAPAHSGISS